MHYEHNLTSKSQVTIPKDVRAALGVEPGGRVRFEVHDNGSVTLEKADDLDHDLVEDKAYRARLTRAQEIFSAGDPFPGMTTDEFMDMIREPVQPFEVALNK